MKKSNFFDRFIFPLIIIFILIPVILIIAGCGGNPGQRDKTLSYPVQGDLSDCRIYELESQGPLPTLTIVRCPNATTSTNYMVSAGKSKKKVVNVVIDGVEYEIAPKEKQ